MMKCCFIYILILLVTTVGPVDERDGACAYEVYGNQPLRVLFIGNSFTYVNDLPWLTKQLASSAKEARTMEAEMIATGGATLKSHWEGNQAVKAIQTGRWDFVVLQEQSSVPINQPDVMHRYARLFDAEIKRAGAQTIFYLTWARQDQSQAQASLAKAYVSIARELNAKVAPVGLVWQRVRESRPGLKLYLDDGIHSSPAGSYLAACVFYATLYGRSPVGLSRRLFSTQFGTENEGNRIETGNLSEPDAKAVQQLAWQLSGNI